MKIFIEVPVWLGDTIMASVAVDNVISHFKDAHVTVFGSKVTTEIYKAHPKVDEIIVDVSKQQSNRWAWLYKKMKSLGRFDFAISFRRQYSTRFLLFVLNAKEKYRYKRLNHEITHQVKRYNDFASKAINAPLKLKDLYLPFAPKDFKRPTLGINPGAAYGSAKRWYPKEFAKVAHALSDKFDIIIFGGAGELEMANDVQKELQNLGTQNITNLAGKTDIKSLCEHIGGLSLFITNDSGPLHISASYKINTVAIFGPTIPTETHGWNNPNEHIVKLELACQPCMKRICPLKHHNCMKNVTSKDVLDKIGTFVRI